MRIYVNCIDSFGQPALATSITTGVVTNHATSAVLANTFTIFGRNIIYFTISNEATLATVDITLNGVLTISELNVIGYAHTHSTATITGIEAAMDARIAAQKAQASGLCPLDANSLVPTTHLPALAITDTFEVASEAAMLALSTAEKGDIAIRSDLSKTFILSAAPYSTLANWKELKTPTDAVTSVNTKTGAVTLTQDDVGNGTTYKRIPKTIVDKTNTSPNDLNETGFYYFDGTGSNLPTAYAYYIMHIHYDANNAAQFAFKYAPSSGSSMYTRTFTAGTWRSWVSVLTSISTGIGNSALSAMASETVKGNATSSSATPQDIALSEQTVLGRITGGHIKGLTVAELVTLIGCITTSSTDTLTNKTLTAPKFADGGFIADDAGNELVKFSKTAGAVNEITIKNNATTYAPQIQASGGDSNIDIQLIPKGSGKLKAESNGYEIAHSNNAMTMLNKTLTAPVISGSSSAPTASEGMIYFNSTSKKLFVYNGTAWVEL